MPTPRLRMFAGPNGSGKSTLNEVLPPEMLGIYLNPDEIERDLKQHGSVDLGRFQVTASQDELVRSFEESALLKEAGHRGFDGIRLEGTELTFSDIFIDSYIASVLVSFLRMKLLESKQSLTLETVMSHSSKVNLLQQAQNAGYRTYLYYIATEDPDINTLRVTNRVYHGGHSVPEDKIVNRYHRSLDLLFDAIAVTNRAYIFDNSGENEDRTWVAEITEGEEVEFMTDQIPVWFQKAVLDKIPAA
jgi:predicted ABC-type ATPase